MNKLFLILSLFFLGIVMSGCQTVPATRNVYVQLNPPADLMDCDRLKKYVITNPDKLTNKQIRLFIENRESIINECFADVRALRSFIANQNTIVNNSNQAVY